MEDLKALSQSISAEEQVSRSSGNPTDAATATSKHLQGPLHPSSFTFLLTVKVLCEDKLVAAVHQ
jgi:hypothetical protein